MSKQLEKVERERDWMHGRLEECREQVAELRAYAGELAGLLSCAVLYVGCVSDPQNPAVQRLREDIRAALAKNPNPAGLDPATEASGSFTTEASGAGGAGTRSEFETGKEPFAIVTARKLLESAREAGEENVTLSCDNFERLVNGAELRHQSGTKPPTLPFEVVQLRETAKSFRASGDKGTAHLMERSADLLEMASAVAADASRHQVCNDDTARMDFLSRGSAFTDHREEDLLRSDTPLGKAVLFSYDGVRYFAKGETLREAVDAAMKRDAELRHVACNKQCEHEWRPWGAVAGGGVAMRCTKCRGWQSKEEAAG